MVKMCKCDFCEWLITKPLLNMKYQCWVNGYTWKTKTNRLIIVKYRKERFLFK